MFHNFFPPNVVPFMTSCGIKRYNQASHRWQYNTAHANFVLDT